MRIKVLVSVWIIGIAIVVFGNAAVLAEEVKWRGVWQINKVDTLSVGDQPEHALGLGQASGLAFFENDEVATVVVTFINDLTGGNGTGKTYVVHQFHDASMLTITFNPVVAAETQGEGAAFEGDFVFDSGTGRYAGITGGGSFAGRRFGGLDSPAGVYFDFTGDYRLSKP